MNLTKSSKRCPQLVTDHVRNLWLFKAQKVNVPVVNVVVTWVSSWDDFCTRRAYFFLYKKSCFRMFKKESECLPSKLYNSDYYVLSNVLFVFHVRLLSHLKLFSHFFYFKKSGMDRNSTWLSCGLHYYTKGHQCYGAQPGTKNCSPILFLNRSAASIILSLNGNRWEGRRTKISRCSPKQKTKIRIQTN